MTGDLNYNRQSGQLSVKIKNLCEEFSLTQIINQPTHYTEHSSSILDVIFTADDNHLSGVADPFLTQDIRHLAVHHMEFSISVNLGVYNMHV